MHTLTHTERHTLAHKRHTDEPSCRKADVEIHIHQDVSPHTRTVGYQDVSIQAYKGGKGGKVARYDHRAWM